LCARIRSPAKRRIDDHFSSQPGMAFCVARGGDFAGGIGTEDGGKTDAGVLAAPDPDIPVVDCRGPHADNDLPWPGHRRGPLFNPKVARIAEFPQDHCAHGARFYLIGSRDRFLVNEDKLNNQSAIMRSERRRLFSCGRTASAVQAEPPRAIMDVTSRTVTHCGFPRQTIRYSAAATCP